ncbi:MAG: DUF4954 family protein [Verrucomicrobiota bacterium]|nr:DUF4954 family protein [Verrucomicrobiota bacterium]
MQSTDYRTLTTDEIKALESNGCSAADWRRVLVRDPFDPRNVRETTFQGDARVGRLGGKGPSPDGIGRPSAICGANLHDCSIGDNCRIANVNGWLSRLDIGDNALIENVGTIACQGETTFGNGHEIPVLNEAGGRELKITRLTSAQVAYLTVLYRDRPALVAVLNAMADRCAAAMRSNRATIGSNATIRGAPQIVNVRIGSSAVIENALSLRNGTLDSSADAPVVVGDGVIAENFIFQRGSSVTGGAVISSTLIGEGCRIGKTFSAENSVFFANSEAFHSEACSVFCGPYSVTHHRSTLLIAALFSFYNAGSGTNQSNHMYKLGPVHQGILERGCKTGSGSYLLWPCRVGPFTAVIGKHHANFDTSDLPFSYIAEEDGKSTIVPAMNFFTVGTMRDAEKWPARDRRKHPDKLDLIIFDALSPFTAQRMLRGRDLLARLAQTADKDQTYVTVNGIHIKRLLLKTCARYYTLALDKHFGDVLLRRIAQEAPRSLADLLQPDPAGEDGTGEWVDLCGLLCAAKRLDALSREIADGTIASLESLHLALRRLYDAYRPDEWNWFLAQLPNIAGNGAQPGSPSAVRQLLDKWKDSSLKLLNMVEGDARKEFEGGVRIGFGIDGNQDADFEAVRGTYDGNKFVKALRDSARAIIQKHDQACRLIGQGG